MIVARSVILLLASGAHAVVLENAGTTVRYAKCYSPSRVYWQVAVFGALVSEEQGAQHYANHF
jgi:hypothetical protein